MPKKLQRTSIQAGKKMTDELKECDYIRILKGLVALGGKGVYTSIAKAAKFRDRNAVSRRMLEMINDGLVSRNGETGLTTSKRNALINFITEKGIALLKDKK